MLQDFFEFSMFPFRCFYVLIANVHKKQADRNSATDTVILASLFTVACSFWDGSCTHLCAHSVWAKLSLHELWTTCARRACGSYREIQATVNREAKNMASVRFFKTTWHVETFGHLDFFGWAVRKNFLDLLCIFSIVFFPATVWEITAMPCSC